MMYQMVGIGNALVDSEFVVDEATLDKTALTKGNMTLADSDTQDKLFSTLQTCAIKAQKQTGGGSGANSAVAFACLGGQAYYHCRVGDDALGAFYLENLGDNGVASSASFARVTGTTGTCAVLVSPDGERTMQTHLGVSSDIDEHNIDFTTLNRANWLYLEGYLAMSAPILPAIERLRQQAGIHGVDIAVSFADPAVVKFAKERLLQLIGNGVAIIFCNLEEAQLFTGKKQHKACAKALLAHCRIAVVTAGSEPTIIAEQVGEDITIITATTPHADVLDTNGAGDNYAGAFLYALTQSYALEDCAKLAGAVAAQVVSQFGTRLAKADYDAIKRATLS